MVYVGFLFLVGGVSSSEGWAESVSFNGSNQHNAWLPLVRRGLSVSRMKFGEVVPANVGAQVFELVI